MAKFKAAPRPEACLDADASIASCEDVDAALRELAWLDWAEGQIVAACAQRIELAKWDAEQQMSIDLEGDGEKTTFADRRAALQESLEEWCTEHRDELLEDGGKTRKFSHGSVAWKGQKRRIDPAEGKDAKDVLAAIDRRLDHEHGIVGTIYSLLDSIEVLEGLQASQLLAVKPSVDKGKLLALLKAKPALAKALRKLHLQVVDPPEKFSATASEYVLRSESAA